MAITAAQVKELREMTGAGMMECKKALTEAEADMEKVRGDLEFDKEIISVDSLRLDTDFKQALAKMDRIAEVRKKLPGLDCGSCGSPTCQALAEDIVGGYAREMDCLFLLKEQVRRMAEQMVDLSELTREK